jgi:hypothetical protein
MKAIIISDKDAKNLLESLELHKLRIIQYNQVQTIEELHIYFHYVVSKWLQEQGADIVVK